MNELPQAKLERKGREHVERARLAAAKAVTEKLEGFATAFRDEDARACADAAIGAYLKELQKGF